MLTLLPKKNEKPKTLAEIVTAMQERRAAAIAEAAAVKALTQEADHG